MEGCPTVPNDPTTKGPVQHRQVTPFVVGSVASCGNSRNARCPANCSGRISDGRYCCRVLQRLPHRLFGSAGGQAALGAPGRPSTWAGARVCAATVLLIVSGTINSIPPTANHVGSWATGPGFVGPAIPVPLCWRGRQQQHPALDQRASGSCRPGFTCAPSPADRQSGQHRPPCSLWDARHG